MITINKSDCFCNRCICKPSNEIYIGMRGGGLTFRLCDECIKKLKNETNKYFRGKIK